MIKLLKKPFILWHSYWLSVAQNELRAIDERMNAMDYEDDYDFMERERILWDVNYYKAKIARLVK